MGEEVRNRTRWLDTDAHEVFEASSPLSAGRTRGGARERRDYVIRHASSCAFALKARRTCRRTRRRWISAAGTRTHLRLEGALEGEHVAEHGKDVSHDYCRRTACGCVDQSGARAEEIADLSVFRYHEKVVFLRYHDLAFSRPNWDRCNQSNQCDGGPRVRR